MPDATIPLDRAVLGTIVRRVLDHLPTGWSVMPIGSLAAVPLTPDRGQPTKDADFVPLALVDGELRIPSVNDVEGVARRLSDRVDVRKDQTAVQAFVALEAGRAKVEFVRGRNNASGGYFVTRRLLLACAATATREGALLRLPPESRAILKAWAATDQDKLMEAGKDRTGYHRARAAGFRQDVSFLLRSVLDRAKQPQAQIIAKLLQACPVSRRARVADVLRTAGWPVP
jgi:hypothetical protein